MQKRNALGRGLDSLISMPDLPPASGEDSINEIPVDLIDPNPAQPRTNFSEESLAELAASIGEIGIVQPLSLRETREGRYQIIAGERRWRAAKMAGLTRVPAYVMVVSDKEVTEMALVENIQREDLNAIEVALAFKQLMDTYHLTQDKLAGRVGKKRATVANHLRLLKLPAEIQLGLVNGKIDMGHARALLSVLDPKEQLKLYNLIVKQGLSVRKVEEVARRLVENQGKEDSEGNRTSGRNEENEFFTRELSNYFPTPVKFTRKANGKGTITLSFANDDELEQLVDLFERMKSAKGEQ